MLATQNNDTAQAAVENLPPLVEDPGKARDDSNFYALLFFLSACCCLPSGEEELEE